MILLDHGASPTTMDLQGQTPLEEAVEANQSEMTVLLYDKTDKAVMRQLNHKGASLLHRLVMKSSMTGNIFALFIGSHSSNGERLVNNHDDINLKDSNGCTLLHRAVQVGNISVVTALVAEGANINAQGPNGDTPIHFAIRYSQEATREYLNKNGASLSLRNDAEQTPLQLYWNRKPLPWAMYERDLERSISRKMSPGGQADVSVLRRKTLDGPGPEVHLFHLLSC
jgi:ankyrin repeat protein